MLKKLRTGLAILAVGFMVAVPALALTAPASAVDIGSCLKQGSELTTTDGTTCTPSDTTNSTEKVNTLITTIINIFSLVVGVVAVIMIIVGGFKYITSGGDSGQITGAKNTIIYAVIGLVIVAFAQFFVQFVLGRVLS